jgi:hypothetical protein
VSGRDGYDVVTVKELETTRSRPHGKVHCLNPPTHALGPCSDGLVPDEAHARGFHELTGPCSGMVPMSLVS